MMKIKGDLITIKLDLDGTKTISGKITKIDYKSIMVQIDQSIFYEFDINGDVIIHDKDKQEYSIDIFDIDVPENPFNFLRSKMDNEGFDYCFDGYSNWEDIEHIKFHILREKYVKAKKDLESFVNSEIDPF